MMREAMDLLRRYVEAHEKIAAAVEQGAGAQPAAAASPPAQTAVDPAPAEGPALSRDSMSRQEVKAALDAAGITYNDRAATKTLRAKMDEIPTPAEEAPAEDPQPAPVAPAEEAPAEEAPAEEVPDPDPQPALQKSRTVQEVRQALIDYAKRFDDFEEGKAKSRELLKKIGGVDRLGELSDDKYDDVIVAAQPTQGE